VIYARSRQPIVALSAGAAALAAACGAAAGWLAWVRGPVSFVALAAGLAAGALATGAYLAWRALHWPPARLCFFRDRILLFRGRTVTTAVWDRLAVVTLAQASGAKTPLPAVKLGNRLTLVLEPPNRPLVFRPVDFGLKPVTCRDLILELRDDPAARARLPEFDSALDLRGRPVTAGELDRRR